jgi:hypothetical protein
MKRISSATGMVRTSSISSGTTPLKNIASAANAVTMHHALRKKRSVRVTRGR